MLLYLVRLILENKRRLNVGDLRDLYRSIGYQFKDESILKLALTHCSVSGCYNNERLEFFGDSILSFVIAQVLYRRFEQAREGQLSRLRAELVSGATLAGVAKELALGDYLYLGPGELKSGGHRRGSILADAMEALIGALYIDAGMDVCETFIMRCFQSRLENLTISLPKDSKTRLQEFLQSRQLQLPGYEVVSVTGEPHAQIFNVVCLIPGQAVKGCGQGANRRAAEQAAAQELLIKLGVEVITAE